MKYVYKNIIIYLRYGPLWRSGDVFGVCLDMDNGTIEYHRNGVDLGKAFTGIQTGPGKALFPAVSLATNDSVTANFGGTPFRYPVNGYQPLQPVPEHLLDKADFLLQHLANLAKIISTSRRETERMIKKESPIQISRMAIYMVIAGSLISELAPLLQNTYVVEDKVFYYIKTLCVLK